MFKISKIKNRFTYFIYENFLIFGGDMTAGYGFSENSGGDMTQDGHDCRNYSINKEIVMFIHRSLYCFIIYIIIIYF